MSYRTLEEKFLADFEKLEIENMRFKASRSFETKILDAAVEIVGRREVIQEVMPIWHRAAALGNNFDEWVKESVLIERIPYGVSMGEFITYFDKELTAAYEDKYAEDQKEEGE